MTVLAIACFVHFTIAAGVLVWLAHDIVRRGHVEGASPRQRLALVGVLLFGAVFWWGALPALAFDAEAREARE